MDKYTPTTEGALYCSSCWADLKLYPPATELVFERDFTVNTETVRKVYRYVRTDATEFDRWLFHIQEDAWDIGYQAGLLDYASSMANNPYRQGEEQFKAYEGIVADAKREERERIVKAFMESFTQLQYFYDGVVKNLVAHVDRPEYCEFVIREIIKEETE